MTPLRKRHRLKNLNFDEVSFCKRGMNQKADILIIKAEDAHMAGEKDGPVARFTKSIGNALKAIATGKDAEGNVLKTDDDQIAIIDKELGEVAKALDSEVEEPVNKGRGKKKADEPELDDDMDDEESMSKAQVDLVVAKAVEEAEERVSKAQEDRIKGLEDIVKSLTSTNELETIRKAVKEATGAIPVDIEAVSKSLLPLSADQRETVLKGFRSANAVATTGLMTRTVGHRVEKTDTPEGQLNALAKQYAKDHKVTFAKAYVEVLDTPEGREAYSALRVNQGLQA